MKLSAQCLNLGLACPDHPHIQAENGIKAINQVTAKKTRQR
jgi:hypothetical protein